MKKTLFPLCALAFSRSASFIRPRPRPGPPPASPCGTARCSPPFSPCMALSGYLISSRLIRRLSPAPLALAAGWLGGYPMGAKTAADLYRAGRITKKQGNRLLLLACAPSPMFLTLLSRRLPFEAFPRRKPVMPGRRLRSPRTLLRPSLPCGREEGNRRRPAKRRKAPPGIRPPWRPFWPLRTP